MVATVSAAIDQINTLDPQPAFVVHTGDLTHTSTPEQFDQVRQLMSTLKPKVFYIPGEHDSVDDDGQKYRDAFGAGSQGDGWYSFDVNGIHFVAWSTRSTWTSSATSVSRSSTSCRPTSPACRARPRSSCSATSRCSTCIPQWGWATDDAAAALRMMKRFGSVTAINGHVHQLMTKVEGNVTFYAGLGTAYPLPTPGQGNAPAAMPLTVPADQLRSMLGTRSVDYVTDNPKLKVVDHRLG